MTRRGRRTREQLKNVPTSDMTPAEYDRSNDDHDYIVRLPGDPSEYHVHGIHSARAVAGRHGTYERKN
jgi:hypothetical protein